MIRTSSGLALLLLAAGCVYRGTPVPLTGNPRLLAGEWEGTYASDETGRSGIITFSLKAGTDSAFGDVLMVPNRPEHPANVGAEPVYPTPRAMARVLRISFVWCSEGEVVGQLDPYEDPMTQERILTTFEGALEGGVLRGTFTSQYPASGRRVNGTWKVTRKAG